MATSDLHAHIDVYDYFADRPSASLGLARVATLIARVRATASNTLLFDNGDFLQGSPLGDYIAEVRGLPDGAAHPVIKAMNALRYDAATLGNHEFNYGLDFLMRSIAAARFPIVCANALVQGGGPEDDATPLVAPFVLLDRQISDGAGRMHPVRVGVIGLLPPQITTWDANHLDGRLVARDIVQTAAAHLPRMRAAGADVIVALCHSGIGSAQARPGMENAATALAALPGLDALVLGHSHLVFPSADFDTVPQADLARGLLCGKPAVMPGRLGSHLGVIDLTLDRTKSGWRIAQGSARAVAVPAGHSPASRALGAAVREDHRATLRHIRRRVGTTPVPLNSFFAMLPGNAALRLIASAQRDHVALALRDTDHADLPVLSAVSPFKMGGRGGPDFYTDVPAGDLTLRNIADLYVFPNLIRAMRVSGTDLSEWLERSAALFNHLTVGKGDQSLLNADMPATEFDVIDGVTWAVDLTQPARFSPEGALIDPAARRIVDLRWQGRPIAATDCFIVATNSYRASSKAAFPGATDGHVVLRQDVTNRDVLHRYVANNGTVAPQAEASWRFAGLPATSAVFVSSSRATAHLGALTGQTVELAGPGPAGYSRFRVHF